MEFFFRQELVLRVALTVMQKMHSLQVLLELLSGVIGSGGQKRMQGILTHLFIKMAMED